MLSCCHVELETWVLHTQASKREAATYNFKMCGASLLKIWRTGVYLQTHTSGGCGWQSWRNDGAEDRKEGKDQYLIYLRDKRRMAVCSHKGNHEHKTLCCARNWWMNEWMKRREGVFANLETCKLVKELMNEQYSKRNMYVKNQRRERELS